MSLLTSSTLIIDKILRIMASDFAITDLDGRQVGTIRTEDDGATRFLLGNRNLTVFDETGRPVLRVEDVLDFFGRDTMVVHDLIDGQSAHIVKEITFITTRLSLTLFDGTPLDLRGNFFDSEFSLTGPRGEYAQVTRTWAGVAEAFLDLKRYLVNFAPDTAPYERQAIIGGVIAIDLVRAKQGD